MTITIDPKLEERLRERAKDAGLTISAYVERLIGSEQAAEDEVEVLALEGLQSGDPIVVGPEFWEERHRQLEERIRNPRKR